MLDCRGKQLAVGDLVKYRSIYSELNSRSLKIYIAKITNIRRDGIILDLLFDREKHEELGEVELNLHFIKNAALEKLSISKATIFMLEKA